MTRKHFQALAAMIATLSPAERPAFASRMADWCATQNAQFNRGKFLAACGLSGDA